MLQDNLASPVIRRTSSPSPRNSLPSSNRSSFEKHDHHSAPIRCVTMVDDMTIRLTPPEQNGRKTVTAVDDKVYVYDKVFSEESTQEDMYQHVSEHVRATVNGYNTTIFAYGSTGSGKSYTMTGCSAAPGIIPRAISEIFSIIETTTSSENDVFFYVRLSYVELYNNTFRNLLEFASREFGAKDSHEMDSFDLSSSMTSKSIGGGIGGGASARPQSPGSRTSMSFNTHRSDKIEVRESASAGVFLAGPNIRIAVTSAKEAFQLINRGNKYRAVGATLCNDISSRSHAVLTLHVESRVPAAANRCAICNYINISIYSFYI